MDPVPFRLMGHLVTVPVRLGDLDESFIIDSGIGVTLISADAAATVGCAPTGASLRGRRMSGQVVEVPLVTVPSLEVGGRRWEHVEAGILDVSGPAGIDDAAGFLSLSLFESTAVTIDYPNAEIVVEEPATLAARVAEGTAVPVEIERDGPSTVVFTALDLPSTSGPIRVEIDMGSDCLILDARFAAGLGIDLGGGEVETVEGRDETGHQYARHFATLRGEVRVTGAPELAHRDPRVMFQRIIHDGLLGTDFLRCYQVTFDLPNAQVVFGTVAGTAPAR